MNLEQRIQQIVDERLGGGYIEIYRTTIESFIDNEWKSNQTTEVFISCYKGELIINPSKGLIDAEWNMSQTEVDIVSEIIIEIYRKPIEK
jgi:hypothetical protein